MGNEKKSCHALLMLKRILSAIYWEDVSFPLQQQEERRRRRWDRRPTYGPLPFQILKQIDVCKNLYALREKKHAYTVCHVHIQRYH